MQPFDYASFAIFRAGLERDYAPANAQERLLVREVATCWQRLEQARHRESLFFDLQKTAQAIRCGQDPEAFKEEGGEVRMWLDQPHKAYDQVLRAIRDAGADFDRAIRRIEQVRDHRLKRDAKALPQPKPLVRTACETIALTPPPHQYFTAEHRQPNREDNLSRAPEAIPKAA